MVDVLPYLLPGIIILLYAILILYFVYGWLKTKQTFTTGATLPFISIVVAVRNEAETIGNLLTNLSRQSYPMHLFEVIISDDFSEDTTRDIVSDFARRYSNIRLIIAEEILPRGKKAALNRAIGSASGELIITTDADCSMNDQWLSTMAENYLVSEAAFLIGPVTIHSKKKRWFFHLQTLEFMSIMGATGGAAGTGNPIMCNGANMAFRRNEWQQVHQEARGGHFLSGDDVFLLHAFRKRSRSIYFVKDPRAIVSTEPSQTMRDFFSQRSRWAGKSTAFTDPFTLATGFLTALTNSLLILLMGLSFLIPDFLAFALAVWGTKMLVDFLLLWCVAGFFHHRKLLWYFPFLSLIYPFYVVTTLFLAIFFPAQWKHRSLKL